MGGLAVNLYAGLCAFLLFALSVNVIRLRYRERVSLGDGDRDVLKRAIRVHGNFIEYAPLALILIYLVETAGFARWQVHALGTALVVGRVAHAVGLMRSDGGSPGRALGMALTFFVLLAGGAMLVSAFLAAR